GFCRSAVPPTQQPFLSRLRETSERRNRDLVRRVNTVLGPAALDYDADVRPLTPAGNATERHICLAYARKAAARFPDGADLSAFWRNALGLEGEVPDLPEGPALLNRIRARTMKRGGIGYVKPEEGAFPNLAETNRFILACGALPVLTWLDGSSEGEGALDELLEVMISHGAEAANIIPDRNFTPGQKDEKLEQLYRFADRARLRGLPLIAGTEMNAPGNRFVDDFSAPELSPLKDDFLRGSYWLFAHTVLEDRGGLGFGSDWARSTFPDRPARIAFYEELGQKLPPDAAIRLPILDAKERPDSILDRADC
ncbi:MAG: hypothetical protein U1E27_02265, partial [Kiritimatiellia bacterium]|nr:hypothetical protein [Kiritimatiellia bacterium]